ncbi:MAG: ATP-binding protein [Muribaculaceae bacterium]
MSCDDEFHGNYSAEERALTDSVVSANANEDSLRVLISRYSDAGNVYGEIICYRELGRIFREKCRFIESIDIHKQGLEKAVITKDTIQIIQALNSIATNYRRMGVLDEAAIYHYQALTLCNAFSDKDSSTARKNRVVSLNGIGNLHMTLQNYEKADSVLRQALAGEHELGSDLGQAINYANLGSIFETHEQTDSARRYYEMSMEYNRRANSDLGIALCHGHFGRLYEKSNKLDSAVIEYGQAYEISSKGNDVWHWLESCLSLARVYIAKGDLATGCDYLQKANKAATEIHSLEHIAEVYRLKYMVSNKSGRPSEALQYYILSHECADSVTNEKNMAQMQNARINYERELKKSEIVKMQKDFQNERAQRRMFIIGLSIFVVIACIVIVFLVYINRLRSQKNKIISQTDKMRATFFTNITHEFRTPLTVIQAAAQELINKSPHDSVAYRNAVDILRHETRLLNLINQILDIAKMDAVAAKSSQWRHGDIVEFIAVLCDGLRSYAADSKVKLVCTAHNKSVEMDFIPDYVQKIVFNLVSNAIKFSQPGDEVLVKSRLENGNICITVSDSGIGISPEQIDNIFAPFYQVSDESGRIGSGIGLSVVKRAVEKMGGKIEVKSVLGEGATFVVTLPATRKDAEVQKFDISGYFKTENTQKSIPMVEPETEDGDGDTLPDDNVTRVLIIEDTPEVARYTKRQLNQQYHYVFASNGADGLKIAHEIVPDIIITDVMMPEMNGFELCRRIKESELLNHIPVVMVTAKASHEDRMLGLEAGADAYIEKPFHADELNVRVEKLLEQRRLLQSKFSGAFQGDAEKAADEPVAQQSHQPFISRVVDAVKKQMSEGKVDYNLLASDLCLSRAQLNRKIKALTGETTTELILKIKIGLAKQLLDDTNKSILEIALECGMDSDSYFCTLFKKSTGLTPMQYRNRNSEQQDVES